MKCVFSIVLFLWLGNLAAQRKPGWKKHIPPGYTLIDTIVSDMNGDRFPEAVLLLQPSDTTLVKSPLRPIVVLVGVRKNKFKLLCRNDSIMHLPRAEYAQDPYSAKQVVNKGFSLIFTGGTTWKWSHTISFVFNEAGQLLFDFEDGYSWNADKPNKISPLNFEKPEKWPLLFTAYRNSFL
jgi:hypothetical protein